MSGINLLTIPGGGRGNVFCIYFVKKSRTEIICKTNTAYNVFCLQIAIKYRPDDNLLVVTIQNAKTHDNEIKLWRYKYNVKAF